MDFYVLCKELLDFFFNGRCINCGCAIKQKFLCKNCAKTVENLPAFAQGKINGYAVFCVCYYENAIKKLIHKLKFKHYKSCANYAAQMLFDFLNELKQNYPEIDFTNARIVPVPTHKNNRYKRGYDNVLEICKKFSYLSGISLDSGVLKKIKFTKPQYELTRKQRKDNPKNSFFLNMDYKPEGIVILVDDIFTTGATLECITELFRKNNIENLICLTVAKTRYRKK